METPQGDTAHHDAEHDLVAWFPVEEAYRRPTYSNEVGIVGRAAEMAQRREE